MNNFKRLPLTIAVAASLASVSSFAADDIAALEQRIQELEAKVVTLDYTDDQQQSALPADVEVPVGIIFSGYARYGALYQQGDSKLVNIGSTGRSIGRLGNEANGGEFQFGKIFESESGVKWNLAVMLDHWAHSDWGSAGDVNLKKFYAGASNIFESQPDLYVWAGRDFHQRPQQGLNDYFWMSHDGQGGGFQNFDFGGAKLDFAFVGAVAGGTDFYCNDENGSGVDKEGEPVKCNIGGAQGNDSGTYAFTSKLHSIDAGIGNLDLYANYGFSSDKDNSETSVLVGATLGLGSSHKLIVKYGDGADNSAFDLAGKKQVLYTSVEGGVNPSDNVFIDYLVSYKDISGDDVKTESKEYAAIVRPMYNWDDTHSTWLEAGLGMVDYQDDSEEQAWKVTLSQNISLGGLPWSRPMLRFYTTVGDVEKSGPSATTTNVDTVSFGAMFEAWW
ncbi:lactam utilization protein LamB [Vibrio genomosp. F10 str. ZF-129]|uniref:Lactam utilization protein LamB n=1 Tax=Vibrio genomosp. F10 str. ZF-129 TaxID=1187848 RepID=A0A1E5BCJ5_9VIBR|nr:carbohydrate porin [Vibrio genomosp. F10]OEE32192.1 lactam utilization protein LamB [Vibrio genomosp. F10 str. ZF-129]